MPTLQNLAAVSAVVEPNNMWIGDDCNMDTRQGIALFYVCLEVLIKYVYGVSDRNVS